MPDFICQYADRQLWIDAKNRAQARELAGHMFGVRHTLIYRIEVAPRTTPPGETKHRAATPHDTSPHVTSPRNATSRGG